VDNKQAKLYHCETREHSADIFTKPLGQDKFVHFSDKVGEISSMTTVG
jgi:hypothetical protein